MKMIRTAAILILLCAIAAFPSSLSAQGGTGQDLDYSRDKKDARQIDTDSTRQDGSGKPVLRKVKDVMEKGSGQRLRLEEAEQEDRGEAGALLFKEAVFEETSKSGQMLRGKLFTVMDNANNERVRFKTYVEEDGQEVSRMIKLGDLELVYDIKRTKKVKISAGPEDAQYLDWDRLSPDSKKELLAVRDAFERLISSVRSLSRKYEKAVRDYYKDLGDKLDENKKLWWGKSGDPYFYYAGEDKILSDNERAKMVDDAMQALRLLYPQEENRPKAVRDIFNEEKKLSLAIKIKELEFNMALLKAKAALKTSIDSVVARSKRSIFQSQDGGSTALIILPDKN